MDPACVSKCMLQYTFMFMHSSTIPDRVFYIPGTIKTSPVVESNGDLVMTYRNGGWCGKNKTMSTLIRFICKIDAGEVIHLKVVILVFIYCCMQSWHGKEICI